MTHVAIWDLDNCLADDSWREKFIDWTRDDPDMRWNAYHHYCWGDKPGNVAFFRTMTQLARPVFFTARPESVRAATEGWIREHLGISAPAVYMRGARGDFRSTPTLKEAMLNRLRTIGGITIVGAFDDRQDAVDMYRRNGIPAAVLAIRPGKGGHINPKTQEIAA